MSAFFIRLVHDALRANQLHRDAAAQPVRNRVMHRKVA